MNIRLANAKLHHNKITHTPDKNRKQNINHHQIMPFQSLPTSCIPHYHNHEHEQHLHIPRSIPHVPTTRTRNAKHTHNTHNTKRRCTNENQTDRSQYHNLSEGLFKPGGSFHLDPSTEMNYSLLQVRVKIAGDGCSLLTTRKVGYACIMGPSSAHFADTLEYDENATAPVLLADGSTTTLLDINLNLFCSRDRVTCRMYMLVPNSSYPRFNQKACGKLHAFHHVNVNTINTMVITEPTTTGSVETANLVTIPAKDITVTFSWAQLCLHPPATDLRYVGHILPSKMSEITSEYNWTDHENWQLFFAIQTLVADINVSCHISAKVSTVGETGRGGRKLFCSSIEVTEQHRAEVSAILIGTPINIIMANGNNVEVTLPPACNPLEYCNTPHHTQPHNTPPKA